LKAEYGLNFKTRKMKKLFALLMFVGVHGYMLTAQNLILNPGCDDTLIAGEIPHWTEIMGDNWTQRSENPSPFAGSSYFFAGVASVGELGQIIDISSDSAEIDSESKYYYFTGYVRSYSQSPPDESKIIIRFLNSADLLLTESILGPYTQTQEWMRVDSSFIAPAGARKVDLRLHSVRHNGSNNDGYYDELYLSEMPLVGIAEQTESPEFRIFPNPFSTIVFFSYTLELPSTVSLRIFENFGRLVAEPVRAIQDAGKHEIDWNSGSLPAGIYFYRLQSGNRMISGKLVKVH